MNGAVSLKRVSRDLGEEIARGLQERYPGRYIYVSNSATALEFESIEERNRFIFKLHCISKSYGEIAIRVGLSKDRVAKIIANTYKKRNNND